MHQALLTLLCFVCTMSGYAEEDGGGGSISGSKPADVIWAWRPEPYQTDQIQVHSRLKPCLSNEYDSLESLLLEPTKALQEPSGHHSPKKQLFIYCNGQPVTQFSLSDEELDRLIRCSGRTEGLLAWLSDTFEEADLAIAHLLNDFLQNEEDFPPTGEADRKKVSRIIKQPGSDIILELSIPHLGLSQADSVSLYSSILTAHNGEGKKKNTKASKGNTSSSQETAGRSDSGHNGSGLHQKQQHREQKSHRPPEQPPNTHIQRRHPDLTLQPYTLKVGNATFSMEKIVLEQPKTEFSLEFESQQLALTLLSAPVEKAIIQLPHGTGSGQSASLSDSQNSDSSSDSGQHPQKKQSGQSSKKGQDALDGKKPPKPPGADAATNIPMAVFGTFRFDLQSAHDLCDRAEEVMVYGFQHCRYTQVTEAIKSDHSPFKKVYDCSIGGSYAPEEVMTTLEGNRFYQVKLPGLDVNNDVRRLKQYCKAGLVNMIIENVKRERQQKKLIPALLIIDIDGNRHRLTPDAVSNKQYTFVTMGELRRVYKLCEDPKLDPKIKAIAAATFKFAKTCEHHDREGIFYSLEQIEPFWKASGWTETWQARKREAEKEEKSGSEVEKRAYWRKQLNECLG